jgi:hypothetical protein
VGVGNVATRREWTLEGARAVLPDVRTRTERAVEEAEKLVLAREGASPAEQAKVDERIQHLIERWKHEMEALGAEVKGVWLVDFDNGSGYYCWRWPETTVDHFHGYDEGFGGRSRIQ